MPRLVLTLAVALFAAVAVAQEEARPDPLPEIAAMARELRYEDCLSSIQTVLSGQHPSAETVLRAVELRAITHVGMGDVGAAEVDFAHLLELDPGYTLTGQRPSPSVAQLFARAQQARPSRPPENLVVAVAAPLIDGAAAAVVARPISDSALSRVVFYARDGETQIAELEADPGGPPWRADVSVEDRAQARRLHVFARGYAPSGELAAVSRESHVVGEEDAAYDRAVAHERRHRTRHRRDEDVPLAERPWFLATIGAVVVVGTVVVVLLIAGGDNRDSSHAPPEGY